MSDVVQVAAEALAGCEARAARVRTLLAQLQSTLNQMTQELVRFDAAMVEPRKTLATDPDGAAVIDNPAERP